VAFTIFDPGLKGLMHEADGVTALLEETEPMVLYPIALDKVADSRFEER
jgi:hypothetical protein